MYTTVQVLEIHTLEGAVSLHNQNTFQVITVHYMGLFGSKEFWRILFLCKIFLQSFSGLQVFLCTTLHAILQEIFLQVQPHGIFFFVSVTTIVSTYSSRQIPAFSYGATKQLLLTDTCVSNSGRIQFDGHPNPIFLSFLHFLNPTNQRDSKRLGQYDGNNTHVFTLGTGDCCTQLHSCKAAPPSTTIPPFFHSSKNDIYLNLVIHSYCICPSHRMLDNYRLPYSPVTQSKCNQLELDPSLAAVSIQQKTQPSETRVTS